VLGKVTEGEHIRRRKLVSSSASGRRPEALLRYRPNNLSFVSL
jgi:hypothetical protein